MEDNTSVLTQKEIAREFILKWQDDPVSFVKEAIGVDHIDHYQMQLLTEVKKLVLAKEKLARKKAGEKCELTKQELEYAKKIGISIDSGRGCGKTAAMSWLIIWFFMMFSESIVLATGPKYDLVKDNLWGDISKWTKNSVKKYGNKSLLKHHLKIQTDKIYLNQDQSKGKDHYAIIRTSSKNASAEDQKSTMSGYHEQYMMIVVDESYGVADAVFEPLGQTLTQAVNFIVLIGNPTKNTGYARSTWTDLKDYYINLRFNAEESSLVTEEHLERAKKQCQDSPNMYRVNVLGLPPIDEPNALIPYSKIMDAVEREFDPKQYADFAKISAADIGAGHDLSSFCIRQGPKVHQIYRYNSSDAKEITNWIARLLAEEEPARFGIDIIGIGFGVEGSLRNMGFRTDVIDIRNKATDKRFFRLRDELFWRLREVFVNGVIDIPNDDNLIRELSILKLDNPDSNAQIKVYSKAKMRKEGIESPNLADALMMTYFYNDDALRNFIGGKKDAYEIFDDRKIGRFSWMCA